MFTVASLISGLVFGTAGFLAGSLMNGSKRAKVMEDRQTAVIDFRSRNTLAKPARPKMG
jgi:hypothetical protein